MAVQERGIRTRNELIRAAAIVFDAHGFTGGSTSMILKATDGVVQGSLYFHFPTKRHIAVAVLEESFAQAMSLMEEIQATTRGALPALIEFSARYATMLVSDVMARAGYRLSLEPSPMTSDAKDALVGALGTVRSVTQRAKDEGDLRPDVDAEAFGRMMCEQFVGIQQLDEVVNLRKDTLRQLADAWRLVLPAVAPADRVDALLGQVAAKFGD